jgi:hypothetical protein
MKIRKMRLKNQLLTAVLLWGSTSVVQAQEKYEAAVYYATDVCAMPKEDSAKLAPVIERLKTAVDYHILLSGHTDSRAPDDYNRWLSLRRAENVKGWMLRQGLDAARISVAAKGEDEPKYSNETDKGMTGNRRVDILVSNIKDKAAAISQAPPQDFYKDIMPVAQKFTGSTDGIMITGAQGTKVNIPYSCLNVPKEQWSSVQISLQEAYKKSDMLLSNLTTTATGGETLESGGMVQLTASLNGQPVSLKEGCGYSISFPSDTIKPGMRIFYGKRNPDNTMQWAFGGRNGSASTAEMPPPLKPLEVKKYSWTDWLADLFRSHSQKKSTQIKQEKEDYNVALQSRRQTILKIQEANAAYYNLKSTQFGWINCDRFIASSSEKINYVVKTCDNEKADIKLVFKDVNGIMSGSLDSGVCMFSNLPLGQKVTVVAIQRLESGKYKIAIKNTVIDKEGCGELQYAECSKEELKKKLMSFDN